MVFEEIQRYFGKKYDIDGNVYELTATMPVSRDLVFQDMNSDNYIIRAIKRFDLETYIR